MAAPEFDITITLSTMRGESAQVALDYRATHTRAERGETSLVTRDNIERAALDALAELMDRSRL